MKTALVSIIGIALFGTSLTSSAEMYGQLHLGATKFPSADIGSTDATLTQDRKGTFLSITGGYQMTDTIGIELSYVDFGTYSNEIQLNFSPFNSGPPSTYDIESDAFSLGVRPAAVPLSDKIGLDFLLGLHYWNSEGTSKAVSYNNGVFQGFIVERNSQSGTDPFYGVEVSFELKDKVKVHTGLTHYQLDDEDFNVWKVGGTYLFK